MYKCKYITVALLMLVSACAAQPGSSKNGGYEIFFANNSSALDGDAQKILREAAHVATRSAPKSILIKGNADRIGTLQHNKALSLKRAEAVAKFLENRGISRDVLDVRAYGASAAWADKSPLERDASYRNVKIEMLKSRGIEYRK